jgi:hypothetical protein
VSITVLEIFWAPDKYFLNKLLHKLKKKKETMEDR